MGLIGNALGLTNIEAFRFKDTVMYKNNSDLLNKHNALKKLSEEYPNNEDIKNELYIVKKGFEGENEIAYQLSKASIGMYVLRDVKVKYNDLTAQIDFIVITPIYTYYIECKNLIGNITVTDKGDFIREYTLNGKKIKKGLYSPLRQVEAQREVLRKIWECNSSSFTKVIASDKFNKYRKVLVVAANPETILNTNKAPNDMKYKILRADGLIRQIEYDLSHKDKDEYIFSQKEMEEKAKYYMSISVNEEIDYYTHFKNKYCTDNNKNDDLRNRLLELRKNRSNEMNIPAYYVFNNEELDKLVELRPKTIEELRNSNILTPIKVKTHGEKIVNLINNDKN